MSNSVLVPLVFVGRNPDVRVFSVALSLARRHDVPKNEVYLALLDWLLVNSRYAVYMFLFVYGSKFMFVETVEEVTFTCMLSTTVYVCVG